MSDYDNAAKAGRQQVSVIVHVIAFNESEEEDNRGAWEQALKELGFRIGEYHSSDILLWIDPQDNDWSAITRDSRSLVITSSKEITDYCRQVGIKFFKCSEDGSTDQYDIQEAIQNHAAEEGVRPKSAPKPKTTLKVLSNVPKEKPVKQRFEEEEETSNEDYFDDLNKYIVFAFEKKENGIKLQKLLQSRVPDYRVLDIVDSYAKLSQVAEQGRYEVLLIDRKLPGLGDDPVEKILRLKKRSPNARLIVVENEADHFTPHYKYTLQDEGIEWYTTRSATALVHFLAKAPQEIDDNWEWETDEENHVGKGVRVPATETKIVHKPVLMAAHSAGGGIGKSTTVLQLGFVFSQMGYKTLMIELDQDKPSLARGSGIAERYPDCPGLNDWSVQKDFKNEESAIAAIKRTSRQYRGLYVLPTGPISQDEQPTLPFYQLETLKQVEDCMTMLYNAALKEFQIVLVDTNPNFHDAAVFTTLKRADKVFYLMEPTKVFLDSAKVRLAEAEKHGLDTQKYTFLLNKCEKTDPLKKKQIEQTLEMRIAAQIPLDVAGYRKSADIGRPYKPSKGESPWLAFATQSLSEVQFPINETPKKASKFSTLFKWGKRGSKA